MARQLSKFTPKEGDLVEYKSTPYWVCEVRGPRIRLLPMDAVSFEDGAIYNLGRLFEVDTDKVKEYNAG